MSVGQRPNGSWYVQYRVPGEKSARKEYFGKGPEGKRRAQIREAEIQHMRVAGQEVLPPGKIYLDSIAQAYLADRKLRNASAKWLATMRSLLNEHFLPAFTHVPAAALTYNEIIQFVAEKWGARSPATRYRYLSYLKAIFRFGVEHEMISKSPLARWRKPKEKKRDMLMTMKDLEKLIAHGAPHFVWAVQVEWELGLRPGESELFKLRFDDVDFTASTVHIKGTKTEGSDRVLPITPRFREQLLQKRKESQSGFVIEYNGKPVTTLKTALRRAAERAKLPYKPRMYDIRHLFASTLIAKGGDLAAVSKLLGHASITTTQNFYYHLLQGEMSRTIRKKPALKVKK